MLHELYISCSYTRIGSYKCRNVIYNMDNCGLIVYNVRLFFTFLLRYAIRSLFLKWNTFLLHIIFHF